MSESDEEALSPLEAPCRVAARQLVDCEGCGRRLQIRTLRYSHVCRRSFRICERAAEQAGLATAAFRERTQPKKKVANYDTSFNKAFKHSFSTAGGSAPR